MNITQNRAKDFIINKLLKIDDINLELIKKEINNIKSILDSDIRELILPQSERLNEDQYEELRKDLEAHFSITVNSGLLLTDNNKDRDNYWWTSKERQNSENYYWNRYRKYSEQRLPIKVVKTLETDVDVVMDNIENPKVQSFSRYGMVVGHVQSGKTGNYSGLICKAVDSGYKFIVVIAGGLNNLRNQTQERINEYFVGTDGTKDLEIKRLSAHDNSKQPISLTTAIEDFNARDANKQTINFDNMSGPMILVIKKNVTTFKNVIKWIKSNTKDKVKEHAMLIIDDESDYGSVNYKGADDPTQINKCIRKLISLFEKSSYVAYTATPFANIFINHKTTTKELGSDLFPKNFIYALDAPTNYMGAKKYFIHNEENLDEKNPHIVEIEDFKDEDIFPFTHKSKHIVKKLPESLEDAIRLFLINISIRYLKGQQDKHNSMLVHVSRFTGVHEQVNILVDRYLILIRETLLSFGKIPKSELESSVIMDLKNTYINQCNNKDFSFDDIVCKLTDIVGTIFVREVHQKSKLKLIYNKDSTTNVIAVGGTSLSRGYTLEGLSVTYFTRNSMFYDTLMQMGRWFGYREGYNELCKVYIPKSISNNFIRIINATEDLMDNLNLMRRMGKTPEEFGLGIQQYPATKLQITAKNKMKSSQDILLRLDLQGKLKENTQLPKSLEENKFVLNIMKRLIARINKAGIVLEEKGANYLWRNVNSDIIIDFFKELDNDSNYDPYGLDIGFPIKFVIKNLENLGKNVDVAFLSIKNKTEKITDVVSIGTQERRVGEEKPEFYVVNKQKVSTSNPENIILDSSSKKLSSKEIRSTHMRNPLLMLHLLSLYTGDKENKNLIEGIFPTYGISFPLLDDEETLKDNTITLKVNSVYLETKANQLGYIIDEDTEEEDDDYEV